MALGSVAFAFSPSWPLALLGALVTGFGFGGIDYGLNQLFATGFGQRGPAMLNILNAHFGIGAIAGPALIGLLGADRYPAVFTAFAVMAALLLIPLGGVRGRTSGGRPAGAAGHPANLPARRTAALLTAFVVLYVLHVGVEAGVGGWEPTHLAAVGHSTTLAASATSVYWLMLTLGRFLVAPLTLRWSEPPSSPPAAPAWLSASWPPCCPASPRTRTRAWACSSHRSSPPGCPGCGAPCPRRSGPEHW